MTTDKSAEETIVELHVQSGLMRVALEAIALIDDMTIERAREIARETIAACGGPDGKHRADR